jgi:hypothetical protein
LKQFVALWGNLFFCEAIFCHLIESNFCSLKQFFAISRRILPLQAICCHLNQIFALWSNFLFLVAFWRIFLLFEATCWICCKFAKSQL